MWPRPTDALPCLLADVESSQRPNHQYRITTSATAAENQEWDCRLHYNHHSHGPSSLDPSVHNIHRRQRPQQRKLERTIAKNKGTQAREMEQLLFHYSESSQDIFRSRDIINSRQQISREALSGMTATQAFVRLLQLSQIKQYILLMLRTALRGGILDLSFE